MIDPAVLDAMVASGCTAEQIAAAVKASCVAAERAAEERRAKDRARKQKSRGVTRCHAESDGIRDVTRTGEESTDNAETVSLSPVPPSSPPHPPNNPLTPFPIQKTNSRGTRLPDDWQLTGPDLAYALSKGLTERETGDLAERFKSWALSASGSNAVKRNWHQAFQGWVQRDGPKIVAARAGPAARPLSPYQQTKQETRDILDGLKAFSAGSDRSGGENPRLLLGNNS
jgi:hypothetical protein